MKKMILGAALLAMVAGCGKDKKNPEPGTRGRIELEPTTHHPGRAAEATILTMESDPDGFAVWATANGIAGWWSGTQGSPHVYDDGVWNFVPPKQWPAAGAYPMNFWAVYPADAAGLTMSGDPDVPSLTATFVVQSSAATQTDLLGARATANVRPATGNLTMTFGHLLSKVDFGLDLGDGYDAYVQGLTLSNVGDEGIYTLTGSGSWTQAPTTYGASYTYFGTIYDDPEGHTGALANTAFAGTGGEVHFYTDATTPTDTDAHLMLMPQLSAAQTWQGAGAGTAPTAVPGTKSYVAMVYRLTVGGNDYIGYAEAGDHPGFDGSDLEAGGYAATDPLFVKVGYPFDLDWGSGKGYTYYIALNGDSSTTGGYLLDQNYYDKNGNRTDLVFGDSDGDGDPDGPTVPDPVIVDGSDIHLVPIVSDWDDEDEPLD